MGVNDHKAWVCHALGASLRRRSSSSGRRIGGIKVALSAEARDDTFLAVW
ncbi:MAG TPA: hypothetical protein VHV77_12290 [Pirellulales bacterium]|jgi:hypothetical protein|nr:hypothetical protein [Pirellulales bacterium]